VHAHFWTDTYLDKIAALGKADTASPQLPHGPDQAAAVDVARHVNDQYAELVACHPQLPREAPETPGKASAAARRMWYDTVGHGHGHPPALRCAADSFGPDRLVLGTDFPHQTGPSSNASSATSPLAAWR
jgi:hypothetical protein